MKDAIRGEAATKEAFLKIKELQNVISCSAFCFFCLRAIQPHSERLNTTNAAKRAKKQGILRFLPSSASTNATQLPFFSQHSRFLSNVSPVFPMLGFKRFICRCALTVFFISVIWKCGARKLLQWKQSTWKRFFLRVRARKVERQRMGRQC